jgi:hypothetical protein
VKGVIGLLGAKGAGKDTVAGLLSERLGFQCLSFAAALYEEVSSAYGVRVGLLQGRDTKESPLPELRLSNCRDAYFVGLALPFAELPSDDRTRLSEHLAQVTQSLGWSAPDLYLADPWCSQDAQTDPSGGVGQSRQSGIWRATNVTAAARQPTCVFPGERWPAELVDSLQRLAARFAELATLQPAAVVEAATIGLVPAVHRLHTRPGVRVRPVGSIDCREQWHVSFRDASRSLTSWMRRAWRQARLEAPRSPRWTLQLWGTEYRRRSPHGRDSYWIDRVASSIGRGPNARIVVTDVRTYGEAKFIEEIGGVLVRIRRPQLEAQESVARAKGVRTALHESETQLLGYPVRLEILNEEGEPESSLEQLHPLLPELAHSQSRVAEGVRCEMVPGGEAWGGG